MSGTVGNLFDSPIDPPLDIPSLTREPTRTFHDTGELDAETMGARIWLGIHFRTAMTDGNALGNAVADHVAANYFQPTD